MSGRSIAGQLAPTSAELMAEAGAYADKAFRPDRPFEWAEVRDAYLCGLAAGGDRALRILRKAVGMAPLPAPGSDELQ